MGLQPQHLEAEAGRLRIEGPAWDRKKDSVKERKLSSEMGAGCVFHWDVIDSLSACLSNCWISTILEFISCEVGGLSIELRRYF